MAEGEQPPAWLDRVLAEVRASHSTIHDTMAQVLAEQRVTNGRVTRIEHSLWGVSGDEPGLVREHREIRGLVLDARAVGRFWRVVVAVLGVSNVASLYALLS